jgi:hypothetical protein
MEQFEEGYLLSFSGNVGLRMVPGELGAVKKEK